jgi:ATP-binding cassette subfamily B protein
MALATLVVIVAGTLYSAGIPYSFKLITDAVTGVVQGGSYDAILWAAVTYVAITTCSGVLWRLSGYAGSYWATGARMTARHALTSYVTLHSRAYFSDRFAGSISNKIGHASNGTRDMVDQFLWEFLSLFVSVSASFYIAFHTAPSLGLLFLVWVVVVMSINVYFARRRTPLSAKAQALETKVTGATVDLLSNITAMQEYARRVFEIDRLKDMIEDRRRAALMNWHYGEHVLTFNALLQAAFAAGMVFIAVRLASGGAISAGDVVLILTLIFRVEDQFLFIGQHINRFGETWGEVKDSLNEILLPHEMPDKPDAVPLAVRQGGIVFQAVTFGYGSDMIFRKLSFSISPGERVGLVGRSGAGKSTLIRLLLHHYELEAGYIAVDGMDISSVTQESLRSAISVVPQEPQLFHRTITENIEYGRPGASDAEVQEASRLAQAHEFISRLPEGYESMVGERGVKLSGGERQRIAIARAILKNAPILLLDEATSALDSESEVEIQKALKRLMQGKTVLAIAHRLSTLREMDRIIVMERGRVIEDGTHDQLLHRGGIYADLWNHQAGGFLQDE